MELHTTGSKADWSYTRPRNRNAWQRLAARTGGLLTPGNVITWLGLAIVMFGLRQISVGNLGTGVLIVLVGRLFDILDGMVAQSTRTKSPLGELTDAVADKIAIFACALVVMIHQLVPPYFLIPLVIIYIFITLLTSAAHIRRLELHPGQSGKLSVAFAWGGLLLYIFSDSGHVVSHQFLRLSADVAIIISLLLGAHASYVYTKTVMEHHGKKK
jgi:phosphatidylglycerophosphate synthase